MLNRIWIFLAGGAVAVLLAVIVVLVAFGSSEDKEKSQAAALVESPTVAPTQPPTSTPLAATPTPEPTAAPPPEPVAALPDRTNCAQIRGTDYRSEQEHEWFLANCTGGPAPAPSGATRPAPTSAPAPGSGGPPPTSGPTEEERRYRTQASAQLAYFAAKLHATAGEAPDATNFVNYALQVAADCDNFVNALIAIEPAPPRFKAVHDQLKSAMGAFSNQVKKARSITTEREFYDWYSTLEVLAFRADIAIDNYNRVVGVKLPNLQ